MKQPCQQVTKHFEKTLIEIWCETCNRLLSISEADPKPDFVVSETVFRDRVWRDHLNTVMLVEKSLKSNAGCLNRHSDAPMASAVMFAEDDGVKSIGGEE